MCNKLYNITKEVIKVTLGEKLKQLRKDKNITLEELAIKLNSTVKLDERDIISFNKGKLSKWENDKEEPKLSGLKYVADFYGVLIDDLLSVNIKENLVPLVGYIAAGSPILAEENIEDYYNIDKRIKADFCLKVKGDSMIGSHILDGDIAFIKSQPTLENGEIGAVLVSGNTATLKKVYVNKDNVILQPSNVNYQPIIISGQDLTEFRILGKLVANLSPKDL